LGLQRRDAAGACSEPRSPTPCDAFITARHRRSSDAAEDEEEAGGAEEDEDEFEDVTTYSTSPGRVQIVTEAEFAADPRLREPVANIGWVCSFAAVCIVAANYLSSVAAAAGNKQKAQ
jgi:hypothetical protein